MHEKHPVLTTAHFGHNPATSSTRHHQPHPQDVSSKLQSPEFTKLNSIDNDNEWPSVTADVADMVLPIDPCARPVVRAAAMQQQQGNHGSQSATMGPQSQRRISQQERTHQLQSQSHRKRQKTTGQQTLFGGTAFDPTKNCLKCRDGANSHKGHDPRCWNDKRKAKTTQAIEDQRLRQHFSAPKFLSR